MAHRHTEPWVTEGKPDSPKELRLIEAGVNLPGHEGRMALPPGEDGYLLLPGGLPLRMDKAAAVLERLALTLGLVDSSGVVLVDNLNAATLSVAQLRKYAH